MPCPPRRCKSFAVIHNPKRNTPSPRMSGLWIYSAQSLGQCSQPRSLALQPRRQIH
jgi:hypothetical protein